MILFADPSNFCIIIVLNFSWDLQSPQEKLKTMLVQNFGATSKSVMVFLKKAYTSCEGWYDASPGNQLIIRP